jgi:hypothetical protein
MLNEREWLQSKDPRRLCSTARRLLSLRSKKVRRKFRLFGCACCRQIWPLLGPQGRNAVEVSERFADDQADLGDLERAGAEAVSAIVLMRRERSLNGPQNGAYIAMGASVRITFSRYVANAAYSIAMDVRQAARLTDTSNSQAIFREHGLRQCDHLRCIFGNIFRSPSLRPAWLKWQGGMVRHIALDIYDKNEFHHLPILADALEEAGCTDEPILTHCRQHANHVRGCWVVDLLLGKV